MLAQCLKHPHLLLKHSESTLETAETVDQYASPNLPVRKIARERLFTAPAGAVNAAQRGRRGRPEELSSSAGLDLRNCRHGGGTRQNLQFDTDGRRTQPHSEILFITAPKHEFFCSRLEGRRMHVHHSARKNGPVAAGDAPIVSQKQAANASSLWG